MEKYCTSLEVSKRLKEAGWKKETKFWWKSYSHRPKYNEVVNKSTLWNLGYYRDKNQRITVEYEVYSAHLSAEILEELSTDLIIQYANERLKWREVDFMDLFHSPNTLADCWIWAKEKRLVKEVKCQAKKM
jgi:hypothetical protein